MVQTVWLYFFFAFVSTPVSCYILSLYRTPELLQQVHALPEQGSLLFWMFFLPCLLIHARVAMSLLSAF